MKVAVSLLVAAMLASCGRSSASSSQVQTSPTPEKLGTATLTETNCDFAIPTALPTRLVSFSLVNKTKFVGHFGLLKIHDDHTFQNLVDYWNDPVLKYRPAPFATLVTEQPVPANTSLELVAPVKSKGTYAFHCGYHDENDHVIGYWHELKAG